MAPPQPRSIQTALKDIYIYINSNTQWCIKSKNSVNTAPQLLSVNDKVRLYLPLVVFSSIMDAKLKINASMLLSLWLENYFNY